MSQILTNTYNKSIDNINISNKIIDDNKNIKDSHQKQQKNNVREDQTIGSMYSSIFGSLGYIGANGVISP
jgi:hypothetical protein